MQIDTAANLKCTKVYLDQRSFISLVRLVGLMPVSGLSWLYKAVDSFKKRLGCQVREGFVLHLAPSRCLIGPHMLHYH